MTWVLGMVLVAVVAFVVREIVIDDENDWARATYPDDVPPL